MRGNSSTVNVAIHVHGSMIHERDFERRIKEVLVNDMRLNRQFVT